MAEQTYGADHLDLVLANGYVSKLLRNGRVVGYLAKHFQLGALWGRSEAVRHVRSLLIADCYTEDPFTHRA